MNPYLKFWSSVYHFYEKRDGYPVLYTFALSSTILAINFIAICDVFRYFDSDFFVSYSIEPYYLGGIAVLNFLLVILPEKYKELKPNNNWGTISVVYIVLSIIFLLVMVGLHRSRNLETKAKGVNPTSMVVNHEKN